MIVKCFIRLTTELRSKHGPNVILNLSLASLRNAEQIHSAYVAQLRYSKVLGFLAQSNSLSIPIIQQIMRFKYKNSRHHFSHHFYLHFGTKGPDCHQKIQQLHVSCNSRCRKIIFTLHLIVTKKVIQILRKLHKIRRHLCPKKLVSPTVIFSQGILGKSSIFTFEVRLARS